MSTNRSTLTLVALVIAAVVVFLLLTGCDNSLPVEDNMTIVNEDQPLPVNLDTGENMGTRVDNMSDCEAELRSDCNERPR
jgi:hypothetical protein